MIFLDIFVCIGSSCHLKGSYQIVNLMKENLDKNGIADKVNLNGAFCFGKCSGDGVTVKIDDEIISGVNKENFSEIFSSYVLRKFK